MKLRTIILCLALSAGSVLLLTIGCTRNIAGATTETTNGVSGAIRNGDGTPASNSIVKLFPDEYNPVADSSGGGSFIDTTDIHGSYRFSRVAAGSYVVIARNRLAETSFMVRDVTADDEALTTAPEGTLGRSGSIGADFSSGDGAAGGYVYIPGTDIVSPIGSNGSAVLADVPPGIITTVIFADGDNVKRNILRDEISLAAGAAVTIEQPLCSYTRRIVLNTTSAGAYVTGNVDNFPVLVRLNSSNFDFSQAGANGGDLVFTGRGSAVLPFEIERWDADGKRAEIWVKVDTVFGNDSSQSIAMYWGNSGGSSSSAGAGVFDTADGYQGVWHLGESAGGTANDATVNNYDGDSPENARPEIAAGAIGNARRFDGAADFITMPNTAGGKLNFPEEGYYTVSSWVNLDTLDLTSHCIVSKGFEQYYLRSTPISGNSLSTPQWEFVEFTGKDKWRTLTNPAISGAWVLLTGVRQGTKQVLYCNGAVVDSTVYKWTNDQSRVTSNDLFVGRFAQEVTLPPIPGGTGFNYFKGGIDEVRIISAAQSPDWVRLCYMNQRSDDRLTVFR